ncbi:DinB family protein [Janibacter anophelis]|uniref:DinB family protein n=1 Tax=Janibacter anophelis TaxID=319054 RepID=UPI003F81A821
MTAPVTGSAAATSEREGLVACLRAQRASVLAIVSDLDETSWRSCVVPSGWTPLGLLEHLGGAERFWGQRVLAGSVSPLPWPPVESSGSGAGFVSVHGVPDVIAFYREQCSQTDRVLEGLALDDRPPGVRRVDLPTPVTDVRDVVLHLVEETARHAGHLDIARELLDGRTGLGPR